MLDKVLCPFFTVREQLCSGLMIQLAHETKLSFGYITQKKTTNRSAGFFCVKSLKFQSSMSCILLLWEQQFIINEL